MKRYAVILAALALAVCLGCTEERRTTWEHGESTKEIFASQVANPDAGKTNEPVEGLSGKVAAKAVKTYQEGSDKDKQGGGGSGPAINLNLNSGSGSGK